MRTCNWGLEVQMPLLSAVGVFPGSSEGLPVPAPQCRQHWAYLSYTRTFVKLERWFGSFSPLEKFTFPVSFQTSVTSNFWPHHQAKRDSQTSLVSSAQIQRKIKAKSGKCSTWCGRRRGRLVGRRVSNALSGRGLGRSLWTGTANSSCSSWPGCCFSQLCLNSRLSELRGWTSVWARWEALSVFLSCSCLWGIGKNESDTVL